MVQVLPGFAPQLGQNIASIVGSLQNIADPDYEVKEKVRQMAMENPDYAQKLADFSYSNPEAFKALKLGKITDVIKDISPSLKATLDKAQKGFVEEASKNPDKELAAGAGQTALYGKTREQLEAEHKASTLASVNIAVMNQNLKKGAQQIRENDLKLAELDLQAKAIQDATKNYPELQNLDLGQVATDFMNGKAPAALLTQIGTIPEMGQALDAMIKNKEQQRQIAAQRNLMFIGQAKQQQSAAEQMWRATRAGTPALWSKVMTDSKTQDRYAELMVNPKLAVTTQDQLLAQMGMASNEKQNGAEAKAIHSATAGVLKAMQDANKPMADKASFVGTINLLLAEMNKQTGDLYEARLVEKTTPGKEVSWGRDIPEKKSMGIRLYDVVSGKEISVGEIAARNSGAPTFNTPDQNKDKPIEPDLNIPGVDSAKVNKAVEGIYNANLSSLEDKLAAINSGSKYTLNEKKAIAYKFGIDTSLVK